MRGGRERFMLAKFLQANKTHAFLPLKIFPLLVRKKMAQTPAQSINYSVPLVSTPLETKSTCSIAKQTIDRPGTLVMVASRGRYDGTITETLTRFQDKSVALVPRECHNTLVQIVPGKDIYRKTDAD